MAGGPAHRLLGDQRRGWGVPKGKANALLFELVLRDFLRPGILEQSFQAGVRLSNIQELFVIGHYRTLSADGAA